jgi:hypothetical protein
LRNLLRDWLPFVLVIVLAAARIDRGRIVAALRIRSVQIFGVGLLDGLGEARCRICGKLLH